MQTPNRSSIGLSLLAFLVTTAYAPASFPIAIAHADEMGAVTNDWLQQFQDNPSARSEIINRMIAQGDAACGTLWHLLQDRTDPDGRREILAGFNSSPLSELIVQDKLCIASLVLYIQIETSDPAPDPESANDYAAFMQQTGRLDEHVKHWEARVEGTDRERAARVLTYLYRAKGDLARARWAAAQVSDRAFLNGILQEAGAWSELSDAKTEEIKSNESLEALGYLAAYQRLSGNRREFGDTIAHLIELNKQGKRAPWGHELLFVNDCPAEGLEWMMRDSTFGHPFDLLCEQLRYKEAFALLNQPKLARDNELIRLQAKAASILNALDEPDKANTLLVALMEDSRVLTNSLAFSWVVQSLFEMNRAEDAMKLCVQALEVQQREESRAAFVNAMFPRRDPEAALAWRRWHNRLTEGDTVALWGVFRRRNPNDSFEARLKRIGSIYGKAADPVEIVDLARDIEGWESDRAGRGPSEALLALIRVCLRYDQIDLVMNLVKRHANIVSNQSTALAIADWLAAHERWAEAAEWHGRLVENERGNPLAMILLGRDLLKLGQTADGRKCIELAHLLPLGSEGARWSLADALASRGLLDEEQVEIALRRQTHEMLSPCFEIGLDRQRPSSLTPDEAEAEAHARETAILSALEPVYFFGGIELNLFQPHSIHWLRLQAALGRHNGSAAAREALTCLAFFPGDITVPQQVCSELDRMGMKHQADLVFAPVFEFRRQLCQDFPRHVEFQIDAAKLALQCRRRMDLGVGHALKAIELSPRNAECHSILAELYFRQGTRALAVKAITEAIHLAPDNPAYREQLKLYRPPTSGSKLSKR